MLPRIPHVIGFDDAPFERSHRGDVMLVGIACAGTRLEGVLSSRIRRDGANATRAVIERVEHSRFRPQLHAVLLQGIAFGGFNVVDIHGLAAAVGLPVLVVCRHEPDRDRIRQTLLSHVAGGARKWRLIEQAGPSEPLGGLWVQRAGIDLSQAAHLLSATTGRGKLPEALRLAHLVAGGVTMGESQSRP
ncbi:endonuclease dU [Chitinimonas lacunae]|uniref:DUF99 family protein n=1 Tax=Chitinimonas lacunae TaxID=1963018 RepID=A0ABV8MXH2_9NEIS